MAWSGECRGEFRNPRTRCATGRTPISIAGFGVPDLALKRGLSKELVVAPYATLLAMIVEPRQALKNLTTLEAEGALGPYGFRDALDYTRPSPGSRKTIVCTFMAHHIGMSIVALNNALNRQIWPRRFHTDPLVRSAELVLQERIPRRLTVQDVQGDDAARVPSEMEKPAVREVETPHTPQPVVGILGNVPYTTLITNAGGGFSRYGNLAVTRWRHDSTRDNYGQWCYVKDLSSGHVWSTAHQPSGTEPQWYRVLFASDRITFIRRDGDIDTVTEIAVASDDAAEVRRIILTNRALQPREIELTSYSEVVLAPPTRTGRTRRFRICSCRPNSWRERQRSSQRDARARRRKHRSGARMSSQPDRKWWARSRARLIARNSLAAGAR